MELSSEKCAQIVALAERGMKQTLIASQLNVSQPVVSRTLCRYRETKSFTFRSRPGRPKCTTAQTDRLIHRCALNNPLITSSQIASGLPRSTQVSCSTIRRRLSKSFGLKAYRPAKKPYLSKKNIRDRLMFCKKYKSWTVDQWKNVMFSDETNVYVSFNRPIRSPTSMSKISLKILCSNSQTSRIPYDMEIIFFEVVEVSISCLKILR